MHAELDQDVGPKLQRAMRKSTSERSILRSEIVLRSGLGEKAESLADEYGMGIDEIRALIVDFNVRRMKAISRRQPAQLKNTMNTEDKAIIEALIDLTPQAFDLPDLRWLPDEIIEFSTKHALLHGIDKAWISEALDSSRPRRPFR